MLTAKNHVIPNPMVYFGQTWGTFYSGLDKKLEFCIDFGSCNWSRPTDEIVEIK